MNVRIEDKIAYIIAVVNEFAAAFSLNSQQAYRYLDRFKAIDLRTSLFSQSTAYVYSILEKEILTGKLG